MWNPEQRKYVNAPAAARGATKVLGIASFEDALGQARQEGLYGRGGTAGTNGDLVA